MIKNEGFKVLHERLTTGEMHFPLLVFTLSCSPNRDTSIAGRDEVACISVPVGLGKR